MQNTIDLINGLNDSQVKQRKDKNLVNSAYHVPSKSILNILKDNIITLFNILNIVLAVFVLLVESYKNILFLGVIFSNIAIGIFQEIRAKIAVDKLSLISSPKARVIRNAKKLTVSADEIVLDDICELSSGMQVCADSIVVNGECEADESLVTGESDAILKRKDDLLLSGSFITSGSVCAKVEKVGADNYANKITASAKYIKKNNSQMLSAIKRIIKIISICIVPIGAALFFKNIFLTEQNFEDGVVKTVGSIIGMIPEGLVLLTSIALAVSVIRLAKSKTLVQDMYSIETLARVNVLCLDKTGTITEGSMKVDEIIELDNSIIDAEVALNALSSSLNDDNATFTAIKERFNKGTIFTTVNTIPFSSARKFSAAVYEISGNLSTIVLGAAEFILPSINSKLKKEISAYSQKGKRVLLLAHIKGRIDNFVPQNADIKPIALILLSDKIRKEAPETLSYFEQQGVKLKIISGDNPITVSSIAKQAGLKDADKYIDASTLKTDEELYEAIRNYNVFGRVTPQQKHSFIKALQEQGNVVGMTGDGANDVLALKEADCSIAMQSGSDAARNVSSLILLDSSFASLPKVVAEGRRTINNIERSASLFIVKTIFSFLLAIIQLILNVASPFMPIQMTMINAFAIGIPSFILAMEPNHKLVKGGFLSNILKKAIPGALTIVSAITGLFIISKFLDISPEKMSTMATIILGFISLSVLFTISVPFNKKRLALFLTMAGCISLSITLFASFFEIEYLGFILFLIAFMLCLMSISLLIVLTTYSQAIVNFTRFIFNPKAWAFLNKRKSLMKFFKVVGITAIVCLITWISTAVFDFNTTMIKGKSPTFAPIQTQSHAGIKTYDGFGYKITIDKINNETKFYIMGNEISNKSEEFLEE